MIKLQMRLTERKGGTAASLQDIKIIIAILVLSR